MPTSPTRRWCYRLPTVDATPGIPRWATVQTAMPWHSRRLGSERSPTNFISDAVGALTVDVHPHRHAQALGGVTARETLPWIAMTFAATQVGLLAAELEARGFVAGIGKFILIVIIVLVVGGALLGFAVGRRR